VTRLTERCVRWWWVVGWWWGGVEWRLARVAARVARWVW
jgi:hypothetical protein